MSNFPKIKFKEDCGCLITEDNKPFKLNEGVLTQISEGLKYHYDNNLPISENIYRPYSNSYFSLFREARQLLKEGKITSISEVDKWLLESEIGEFGEYNGHKVPLDFIMTEELILNEAEYRGKKVELNKPKRGGPKKFTVYTKNPKTGKVVKVNFGMAGGGLRVKLSDPKARKAFSKRHNCPEKKDKTKPGFWACALPRYAKLLRLSSTVTSGYW